MPDFGDGSPREEYGSVDPYAPSVANGMITPQQWDEYTKRRSRNFILGLLGTVGGAAGSGLLSSMFTGGAGVASAAGSAGADAGGALAPLAGGSPWSLAPYAGSVAGTGTGVGAGAAAGGAAGMAGAGSGLLGGLSARDLAALGLSLGGTIGGVMTNRNNGTGAPNTQTNDPQLQALLQSMQRRLDKSEPLYDSVMAMANGLLPTQYQKGGGGMP